MDHWGNNKSVYADTSRMANQRFKSIQIQHLGLHYVVPEAEMDQLLEPPPAPSDQEPWPFEIFELPQRSELTVGYLVRHHRTAKGLKVRGLARQVQRDHKHILRIEKGQIRKPEVELLRALAEALGPKFRRGLEMLGISLDEPT